MTCTPASATTRSRLVEEVHVDLPAPRDQITTKELDDFVRLRGHVARLIRGVPGPA